MTAGTLSARRTLLTTALLVLAPFALQAQAGFTPPSPYVNAPPAEIKRMPGDGDGTYKTGKYRDLFAEQGHPAAETKGRLEKAFQQLFHGDAVSERVYFEAGKNENGPLGYMTDWANNDARTEGMSYGMMIAVQMDHKREFDALWNWSNTYMLITDPHNPNVGYFAWSMNTDGTPRSTGPAPDGEEYYVMALYLPTDGATARAFITTNSRPTKFPCMRHHPVLNETGPFRIHPEDQPFQYTPLTSPNTTEREQAQHNLAIELERAKATRYPIPSRVSARAARCPSDPPPLAP